MSDSLNRSLVKSVSWRVVGVMLTTLSIYIASGSLGISLIVGGIDGIAKTIFYFIHERAWNKIKWGTQ